MTKPHPAFHAYCDGFELITADIDAVQAFIDRRKQDCRGKVLKVVQGINTGCGFIFDGNCPRREAVL